MILISSSVFSSSSLQFKVVVTAFLLHRHCHLYRDFHSPSLSLPPICIVTSYHLHRYFISSSSSFTLTFIVTCFHLHRHLLSSSSSLPVTNIVTSSHLQRHFHVVPSSFPLSFIVTSTHLHRQFDSPSATLSFTLIVFAHVACHLQSSYYSSLSVSRTSKEHRARQDTDHLQRQRNWEPGKAQTISPAAKELRARQDTNHFQRHRNLKADKAAQLISSLNALVRSAGFFTEDAAKILLLPIFSHGSTAATVSSWVHLILSSNISRKFKTLLQDSFSWHPATTTQHLSWENCTGFPFQTY